MPEAILLSVILPCRNQADHIGDVLSKYAAPLEALKKPFELVVVPNACTDETYNVVQQLAEKDRRIVVVENPKGGWGLSVLTGLATARGEILCYTNSARTDPAHIPMLLEKYLQAAPCVAKVRREKRAAPTREIGSWLYNLEGRLLFGIQAADVNGTPKIFSRELYAKLDLFSEGDLLDMELLAKVSLLKLPVVEFPVAGFKRHGGKSSTNLKSAWNMYMGALRIRDRIREFSRKIS